jgi:hypothetical protein
VKIQRRWTVAVVVMLLAPIAIVVATLTLLRTMPDSSPFLIWSGAAFALKRPIWRPSASYEIQCSICDRLSVRASRHMVVGVLCFSRRGLLAL